MPFPGVEHKSLVVTSPIYGQNKIGGVPDTQKLDYFGAADPHAADACRSGPGRQQVSTAASKQVSGYVSGQSSARNSSDRMATQLGDQDLALNAQIQEHQKYLVSQNLKDRSSASSVPPTPPPKDQQDPYNQSSLAYRRSNSSFGLESPNTGPNNPYFPSRGHSRTNSIYSLSRLSFSSQISQLTSIQLPDPTTLSASISAITTSSKATRALHDAGEQIQVWIRKASNVLEGLNADDDVEWAAAAGGEGVKDVDEAISHFENLITVYVTAVEQLQRRPDVSTVPGEDLRRVVGQVEKVVQGWQQIKDRLRDVKGQVELAMEWEELRDRDIGELSEEIDGLCRSIFEMEEQRYKVMDNQPDVHSGVDISELETIMESSPTKPTKPNRMSIMPAFPQSAPLQSPGVMQEDTSLLGLFARMQPLRASLDFLPIKLSGFRTRGKPIFPSAANELEELRASLEERWQKLEADAESLRRELGEDRWVLVFKNAGKQALKMIDSVSRTITKVDESLDNNTRLLHAPSTMKKIESYEAKKVHYCPAIERVLAIVDRGVRDRITVNGEILRLQADMHQKWRTLQVEMKTMDSLLEEYDGTKNQQLRDSLSSILSSERSMGSSAVITPGSSPASSVGMSRKGSSHEPSQQESLLSPIYGNQSRQHSGQSGSNAETPTLRRLSLAPAVQVSSKIPKKPMMSQMGARDSITPTSSPASRHVSNLTPSSARSIASASSSAPSDNKPRWNASTRVDSIGHGFKPLSATEPSPYRKISTPIRYTPRTTSSLQHATPPASSPLSYRTSRQASMGMNSSQPPKLKTVSSMSVINTGTPRRTSAIAPQTPLSNPSSSGPTQRTGHPSASPSVSGQFSNTATPSPSFGRPESAQAGSYGHAKRSSLPRPISRLGSQSPSPAAVAAATRALDRR